MRRNRPGFTSEETWHLEWKEWLVVFEDQHPGILYVIDLYEVEL